MRKTLKPISKQIAYRGVTYFRLRPCNLNLVLTHQELSFSRQIFFPRCLSKLKKPVENSIKFLALESEIPWSNDPNANSKKKNFRHKDLHTYENVFLNRQDNFLQTYELNCVNFSV